MRKSVDPGSPGRVPLSRARVLQGALDVADAGGIGSLTIRSLARELGAKPMSVYHHVANKEQILDGIVDLVFSEIELPSPGGDWRAEMRRRAISAPVVPTCTTAVTAGKGTRSRTGSVPSISGTPHGQSREIWLDLLAEHCEAISGRARRQQWQWPWPPLHCAGAVWSSGGGGAGTAVGWAIPEIGSRLVALFESPNVNGGILGQVGSLGGLGPSRRRGSPVTGQGVGGAGEGVDGGVEPCPSTCLLGGSMTVWVSASRW